jgi:hypothetical protein
VDTASDYHTAGCGFDSRLESGSMYVVQLLSTNKKRLYAIHSGSNAFDPFQLSSDTLVKCLALTLVLLVSIELRFSCRQLHQTKCMPITRVVYVL